MSLPASLRRLLPSDEGAVAVEFALIVPLVLLVLAAIVDFGFAVHRQMQVTMAVQAGAQLAAARAPTAETVAVVEAAVRGTMPEAAAEQHEVTVELFCEWPDGQPASCSADGSGQAVFVAIRLTELWQPIVSYLLVRRSVVLVASQTVRVR